MKTLKAKELCKNDILIEKDDNRFRITKIEYDIKGSIGVWMGRNGLQIKLYNPNDVVVIE